MKSVVVSIVTMALVISIACTHTGPASQKPEQKVLPAKSISDIAHDSVKSVVTIITYDSAGQVTGFGSGFFVSTDGKVVTNYHVIAGADSAEVKLADGGRYAVEGIVGTDKDKDVAVLKVKATEREFVPLHLADSTQLRVGDEVVVIGSPHGLEGTVSTGVISARRTGSQMEVLQITAPISPGSQRGCTSECEG